jgi:hypothetical protein
MEQEKVDFIQQVLIVSMEEQIDNQVTQKHIQATKLA